MGGIIISEQRFHDIYHRFSEAGFSLDSCTEEFNRSQPADPDIMAVHWQVNHTPGSINDRPSISYSVSDKGLTIKTLTFKNGTQCSHNPFSKTFH